MKFENNFSQYTKKDRVGFNENASDQGRERIRIPEGRMESPHRALGIVEVHLRDDRGEYTEQFDLLLSSNFDRERDLYVRDTDGNKHPLIQLLVNFNDHSGRHEAEYVTANPHLIGLLSQDEIFQGILDRYIELSQQELSEFLRRYDDESNGHPVRRHVISAGGKDRSVEFVHQNRSGDCVIANYLNTNSVEGNGHIGLTVSEGRSLALRYREAEGEAVSDIMQPDSPLSYRDAVSLFSSIYGQPPQQEDILTVEGRDFTPNKMLNRAYGVLSYLDTYPSGLVFTGLGNHSRTIKKLATNDYIVLDPTNPQGVDQMNVDDLSILLASLMLNRSSDQNFFFFIRK